MFCRIAAKLDRARAEAVLRVDRRFRLRRKLAKRANASDLVPGAGLTPGHGPAVRALHRLPAMKGKRAGFESDWNMHDVLPLRGKTR